MTITKLATKPYAQACVITDDEGNIYLRSYATIVAKLSPDGYCEVYGLYSATTRKHIGAFAHEYCDCYYQALKAACELDCWYNINLGVLVNKETGEVIAFGD